MNRHIVFTAYNRPDYLKETIASWNKARSIQKWPVTFHVEPSVLQSQVIEEALKLDTETTVVVNENKLGVLVNPWQAVNNAFELGADFVVLAEDDVKVSNDILEFFEWTSEEYEGSKDILAINAFSRLGTGKPNQLIKDSHFSPLVWGIWKDRWETHLKDTWDKDYSTGKEDGSEAGWDWNINRILAEKNLTVLKPLHSRSDHIGKYNGTHMTPELFDESRGTEFTITRGRQRYSEI